MNRLSYPACRSASPSRPWQQLRRQPADPLTAQPACQSRDDISQLLTQRFARCRPRWDCSRTGT